MSAINNNHLSCYPRNNDVDGNFSYSKDISQKTEPLSRWDTKDTFQKMGEIWNKPTVTYEPMEKKESFLIMGGEQDPRQVAARREAIPYTIEDVAGLKQRFSELAQQRQDITSRLQALAESAGIKLGYEDQMKVEVDSEGNIIVGGIEDAKKARKLEQIINKDESLVKDIKYFQKEERKISSEMQAVTGKSLSHFRDRIYELQKFDKNYMGWDVIENDIYQTPYVNQAEWGIVCHTREQGIALKDQDLWVVDEEFATMISDYYRNQSIGSGALGADITGSNNILENADGTVEAIFNGVLKDINKLIKENNDRIYASYTDPKEIERQLLSLAKVTIRLDSDGAVDVKGTFSISGAGDEGMKQIIKRMFAKTLEANPETGRKNEFFIAAQYLEGKYDLAFDGKDKDRKVEVVHEKNKTESRLSSPKEENRLSEEISIAAKAALDDMGIEADSLEIGVNKDGKIVVANMPQDKFEYDALEKALETLNMMVQDRTNEDYNKLDDDKVGTPAERLKGLLAKMDVFLPGGLDILSNAEIPETIE